MQSRINKQVEGSQAQEGEHQTNTCKHILHTTTMTVSACLSGFGRLSDILS